MIKSLRLENFQSHKDSMFEFDKGLNVIVGSSNQGKTSLARALSLMLYNVWDKSWTRVGSNFCRITLVMDNGITVIREKGSVTNKYILQVPQQQEQIFSNFGTEVPEVISKVLHIGKIELDKDDSLTLNYASQLEPLFLFNRSGSQKAKVFGRLSGAHYLDHALRNLNAEKKQISVEKNLKGKELEELKVQHAALSKIYDFAAPMMGLIAAEGRIEETTIRVEALKTLFVRTQDFKRRYTLETQREAILAHSPTLQIQSIEAPVQRLSALKQLLSRKSEILDKENTLNSMKTQLGMEFEAVTTEYTRILVENKVCPTCFAPLDNQKLEEIKNNLTGKEKCHI